ncbi:MAG: putative dsRNA-binding protein [Methanolobus sp.]
MDNYPIARDFVYRFFDINTALEKIQALNPKGTIQEFYHQNGLGNPVYKVIDEEGPDHEKEFTVGLYIGSQLLATGSGSTKKKAEKAAAALHLKQLKK